MASDLDYYRILRLHGFVHSTLPSIVDTLSFQCRELGEKRIFTAIKTHFELIGCHSRFYHIRSPSVEVATKRESTSSSEGANGTLLIHSPAELKSGWRKQKRYLSSFSDALPMSNTMYKKNFKIKDKTPLSTTWTDNRIHKAGEAGVVARKSFVLGWPTVNFVAPSRYVNLAKEKDQSESIPLQIFTEDIKNSACSVTVTVTNSDTVNDVINMSLSKLGITGSEKDYQLWISSAEKKTSYPLTGTGLLQQELEGSTSASALQEAFLEGPQEIQDQFILKPRHSARNQARNQRGKGEPLPFLQVASLGSCLYS
ncbi:rho GTPase-activating protein 20-like [Bubalus kerabau]|uniref:rho GTPase-activating protein 20-like n=2 Tax=Bubalus carabanensis TaxID=3119969 RepID=UPI00244E614F|nr:rho GTPase-activating protein 20-like [Bubalus carabanensis]